MLFLFEYSIRERKGEGKDQQEMEGVPVSAKKCTQLIAELTHTQRMRPHCAVVCCACGMPSLLPLLSPFSLFSTLCFHSLCLLRVTKLHLKIIKKEHYIKQTQTNNKAERGKKEYRDGEEELSPAGSCVVVEIGSGEEVVDWPSPVVVWLSPVVVWPSPDVVCWLPPVVCSPPPVVVGAAKK